MSTVVSFSHKGDWDATTKFLNKITNGKYLDNILEKYAEKGVSALQNATPKRTGKTAASWYYKIAKDTDSCRIDFCNSNIARPTNQSVAILIQYGHLTKNGYFIEGRDYINPAIQPIFDDIAESAWKEVTAK